MGFVCRDSKILEVRQVLATFESFKSVLDKWYMTYYVLKLSSTISHPEPIQKV